MALKRWRKVSEEVLFRNPWWTYKKDACILPSGKPGEYHYVHTNGSSLIIPIADNGTMVLVNQYRYLVDRESIEFPCGSVDDGSSYDETARHELQQETGYAAGTLTPIATFNPYNGVTDEFCRVYIAQHLRQVGGIPDETEEFELMMLGAGEIDERIANGSIWDGMTIAAWGAAREGVALLSGRG